MNIHRVITAKVEQYSGIESEQQCHHDIVLDGIVSISPVSRSTIGYSATLVVTYDREYNSRLSLHFPFYGKANEARDALVAAWKEHQSNIKEHSVLGLDAPNGLTSIDLRGLRAASPSDKGVTLVYSDGSVELAIESGSSRDTLLQQINTCLNQGE